MENKELVLKLSQVPPDPGASGKVWLEIALENNARRAMLVNGRLLVDEAGAPAGTHELELRVTDAAGKTLPFNQDVNAPPVSMNDFVLLEPGAKKVRRLALDHYFVLPEGPGAYRVEASYTSTVDQERDGQRAFRGTLHAGPIEIRR